MKEINENYNYNNYYICALHKSNPRRVPHTCCFMPDKETSTLTVNSDCYRAIFNIIILQILTEYLIVAA